MREHLPDEADEPLKGRVQVINLWRPIRGPLRDAPLAMLDGQSLEPGDLVASDLIYPNRSGETYSVKYNPNHRWFYVPEMTADEALLLKCYDLATDGRTRFGPHTAFIDPTTPADAPPRESIDSGRWCSTGNEAPIPSPRRHCERSEDSMGGVDSDEFGSETEVAKPLNLETTMLLDHLSAALDRYPHTFWRNFCVVGTEIVRIG